MKQNLPFSGLGFAGELALNWRVWLLAILPPQILLSAFGNFGSVQLGLIATVIAMAASAPFFLWLGPRALSPMTTARQRSWGVIAVYLVTSIVTSLAVQLVVGALSERPGLSLASVTSGAIFYAWFLLLVGEVINDRFEFLGSLQRLEAARAQLEQVATWRQTNLKSARETEIGRISNQLDHARDQIAASITNRHSSRGLSDEVIRTLLREIDAASLDLTSYSAEPPATPKPRRTFVQVFHKAMQPEPALSIPAAVFIATTWLVTGLSMESWLVALVTPVVAGFALWLALAVVSRVIQPLLRRAPHFLGAIATIFLWLIASVLSGLAPILISGIPATALLAIGVQTTLIILVIAVTLAYRNQGLDISASLAAENEKMEREVVANSTVLRDLRERLRRFVHGDLQSVFVSIERKLTSNATSAIEATSINDELARALTSLETLIVDTAAPPSPADVISDMQKIWRGSIDITYSPSTRAQNLLTDSPVTQSVVSELIIEAITNTAKHDEATSISVMMDATVNDEIVISTTSRGTLKNSVTAAGGRETRADKRPGRGHGRRLFDDVCLQWKLTSHNGTTTFEAAIPVVQHQPDVSEISRTS